MGILISGLREQQEWCAALSSVNAIKRQHDDSCHMQL
jgi:hypothetical protein